MSDKDERAAVRASARVAMWGTVIYAAAHFAGSYLAQYAVAAAVVQMVIAEWGSGRLGIAWSDPLAPTPTTRDVALRAARGAGMALTAAAAVALAAFLGKAAYFAPNIPSPIVALVGAVVPLLLAARDELLLRGLVLRVLSPRIGPWVRLGACGLASVAATLGERGLDGSAMAPVLAGAFFGGVAYGALWLRDRGAWLAWGAHAMFLWVSTSLATGGLVDLRPTSPAGLDASWVLVAALAVVAGAAIAATRRKW